MDSASTSTWRWPALRAGPALTLLLAFIGIGLVQGSVVHAALLAERSAVPAIAPFVWHVTGAIGAWAALPAVQLAVLNHRQTGRAAWARVAAIHLAGYVVFTALHVAVMLGLRAAARGGLGIEAPERALLSAALFEAQHDLPIYAGLAVLGTLLVTAEERRAEQVRRAQLEAKVASLRLEALTAQLDPHFLFNALNTLGAVMYEDLGRAERLLASLGEIMRAALAPGCATWRLAEERAHTERYVELLDARLGERLTVRLATQPGLDHVAVPRFAIQTLVENAVKHNRASVAPLAVHVDISRRGAEVCVDVHDNGVGFGSPPAVSPGHGLARLEEMLRVLHGPRAHVACGVGGAGGARVSLTFPAEERA